MTGKSYSIREMKTIVDYLTENKLYGEYRGRKMWMDFANTKLTTRTWQSLKETFLKRVLPDIHNPYYKLNMEQINSFRAGYDVTQKNNKLEIIHTVSDDSGSNGQNQNDIQQSDKGNGLTEENIAGENIKCSKILRNRSSADTVIVDTCYETAEDIQKDLESPRQDRDKGDLKSLRDCITYSEPLTPMLQEVLDDFQSEPEEEPEVSDTIEIVESVPNTDDLENINDNAPETVNKDNKADSVAKDSSKNTEEETLSAVEAELKKMEEDEQPHDGTVNNDQEAGSDAEKESEIICINESPSEETGELSAPEKEAPDNNTFEKEAAKTIKEKLNKKTEINTEVTVANDSEITEIVTVHASNSECIPESGNINNSNNTDTSLPNNPEALKKRLSNENQIKEAVPSENKTENKNSRKRSNSEDAVEKTPTENKKTKLEKKRTKATSETESKRVVKKNDKSKARSVEPKSRLFKENGAPNDKKETTVKIVEKRLSEEKPSTSVTQDAKRVSDAGEIKNPCLQNVSLYDEQFNKTKYNSSESSDVEQAPVTEKTEVKKTEAVYEKEKDVVMLKSHTESDTEEIPTPSKKKKQRAGVVSSKMDRDRALANVFGFSSAAANSKRRRQLGRRRRTISQNTLQHNHGDSSEWTSESESDVFVSPPRGRKNRQSKKYLKPQSGRILSLEEEGGLFVMYGKKIYPVVKDGKLVKNYLTYLPESDSEEEQNYWKLKYVEEKKKADELKKLLDKAKETCETSSTSAAPQPNPLRTSTCIHNQAQESTSTGKEICVPNHSEKKEEVKAPLQESIKIKFTTKNDQEIHLEGNWPQIHNVLEHVVHIFHKEPQPISEPTTKTIVEPPSSSGISTPVVITPEDPDVHEKVNKIENEIFKEIEERDKEEQDKPNGQESNVTKRRPGRPRKSSQSSTSQSPAKRQKVSTDRDSKDAEVNSTNNKTSTNAENTAPKDMPKRQSRTRQNNDSPNSSETKTIQTRRSKLNSSIGGKDKEEEEVRYMLPPKTTRQSLKATEKKTRDRSQRSTSKAPTIFSSPETICPNSVDSTLGYQDSDISPMKNEQKKKKRLSVLRTRGKTYLRRSSRKISPQWHNDESSNSSTGIPIKKVQRDNSTLNTDVYRSESYQLLMPSKRPFSQLKPIDETNPIGEDVDVIRHLDSTVKNEVQITSDFPECNFGQASSDIGSSSNISLPMSPELSVVESLSISKEMLNTFEVRPTINEMQCSEIKTSAACSNFLMSNIDISVPLMSQNCGFESSDLPRNTPERLVTESLLTKIGTFKIEEQTNVTETLDDKLRNLLLESAKKITAQNEISNMDVDETNIEVKKRAKNKKRCSTPRKRKDSTKSKKVPQIQTVIEEEHTESCSQGGRKSCPPVIETFSQDGQVEDDSFVPPNIENTDINENVKSKGKKKKDIIKVKILRPKCKKSLNLTRTTVQKSKDSVCTDSGINDTESGLIVADMSVDLIHNHSETCLLANECVGDSVEFIENSMKSVLTLGDSMQSEHAWLSQDEFNDAENISPDFFCNNAQDVKSFYEHKPNNILDTSDTVYHSPIGTEVSSLMTEDLSNEPPHSQARTDKWYLLSDEETTNTNLQGSNTPSSGANLHQIFPITCAVPDLSTITEMSRENDDNSRKLTIEAATADYFDPNSIFDSIF